MRLTSKGGWVRIITEAFVGRGLGAGVPGTVWYSSENLPMPQAVKQNSTEFTGEIPHGAVHYDEQGHAAYLRDNAVRVEQKPPALLTAEAVCRLLGWSAAQLKSAVASGFPPSTHRRDLFDGDGYPIGHEGLWHPEAVQRWRDSVAALMSR